MFIKNLKTKKKSKNLNHIKVRLFFNKTNKRTISYKLELHKNSKVYFVFYILLLELANPKTSVQNMFYYQVQKKDKLKVENTLNKKS